MTSFSMTSKTLYASSYQSNYLNCNGHTALGLRAGSVSPRPGHFYCRTNSLTPRSVTTPRRKKHVRFADSLGKPLVKINTFNNEAAIASQETSEPNFLEKVMTKFLSSSPIQPAALEPLFPDPRNNYAALVDKVHMQNVALESVHSQNGGIRGVVRVRDASPDTYLINKKSVFVRVTFTTWATWHDLVASYLPTSRRICREYGERYELFDFFIAAPTQLRPGSQVEFAICFRCIGKQTGEFWDNNDGSNYALIYKPLIAQEETKVDKLRRIVWPESTNFNTQKRENVISKNKMNDSAFW